jgi:hypothetical protein
MSQMGRKFMVIAAISLMPEGSLLFDKAKGGSLDDAVTAAKARQMSVSISNAQLLSHAEQRYLMTTPELPHITLVTDEKPTKLMRSPKQVPVKGEPNVMPWMWSFAQATEWPHEDVSASPAAPAAPPVPNLRLPTERHKRRSSRRENRILGRRSKIPGEPMKQTKAA